MTQRLLATATQLYVPVSEGIEPIGTNEIVYGDKLSALSLSVNDAEKTSDRISFIRAIICGMRSLAEHHPDVAVYKFKIDTYTTQRFECRPSFICGVYVASLIPTSREGHVSIDDASVIILQTDTDGDDEILFRTRRALRNRTPEIVYSVDMYQPIIKTGAMINV